MFGFGLRGMKSRESFHLFSDRNLLWTGLNLIAMITAFLDEMLDIYEG